MDARALDARLREVGLAATQPIDLGVTLRAGVEHRAHLGGDPPGPSGDEAPGAWSQLPRLSIDLRVTLPSTARATASDLEVRGVIGEGGMGRVLLARQRSLDRDVAVKTTKEAASGAAREAILLEGAICGRLEHPAIVPVHALGVDHAGQPALVMKRIEGVGWDALLRDPAHAGWEGWDGDARDRLPGHLQILTAICHAVHFAHDRGVVHRDIKPENVLIGRFGDVYLADWGIAAELGAQGGQLCGTLGYMAPEMIRGGRLDARTDVYLLGATLHEVLTGQLRHAAETGIAAIGKALISEPHEYPPGLPSELCALANRACSAEPSERPASAKDFRDAVAGYGTHRDSVALANEAVQRLEALETLLADEPVPDEVRRDADRLAAEARFGLLQAVERWPENTAACGALTRLEALLDERSRRAAELECQARERDPRVGARSRAVALTVFAMTLLALSVTVSWEHEPLTRGELVAFPTGMLALVLFGIVLLRREALGRAFNRQLTASVVLVSVLTVLGRLLGLLSEISVAQHFSRDGFMMGAVLLMLGITHLRWLLWVGATFLATGIACTLWPAHAVLTFGLGTAAAMSVAAVFAWIGAAKR